MTNPTIALWATNIARPLNDIDGWLSLIDAKAAEAAAAGAGMLVMPEYNSAHWLMYKPGGLPRHEEVAFMAAEGARALPRLPEIARRHGIALLAGTMPAADGEGGYFNRAHLALEDGSIVTQDKLCLTPAEKDPSAWSLVASERLKVIEWRGLKVAIMICLDIELPALAVAVADRTLDLILTPSMTGKPSGYHRVFGCAKARAVELQTIVAAVGTIGTQAPGDTNYSGASVFTPCEEALGFTGIHASIDPTGDTEDDGPMLIARDLPVDTIRALRAGGAEVWPGAWRADRLRIEAA